jgi:leucyl-tRNA synthetase
MVAKLMELTNLLMRYRGTAVAGTAGWDEATRLLLLMLAPLAPHISEELWARRLAARGEAWRSIHTETWPTFDPALVVADTIDLPVQVNGKLRDLVPMAPGLPPDEIEALVMARPKVRANLDGLSVVKVVHVPGRLVNIVAR